MKRCLAGTGIITTHKMRDSTQEYTSSDMNALRENLSSDGYLLIRGLIQKRDVLQARKMILEDMFDNGFIKQSEVSDCRMSESPWPSSKPGPSLLTRYDLMTNETIMNLLENENVREVMNELISDHSKNKEGLNAECLPYKWLRAVGTGLYTGPHLDRVYLGKNPDLLTCWIPIGDIKIENGSLVVAHQSHRLKSFQRLRSEYGLSKVGNDGTYSGWIDHDPNNIQKMYGTEEIDWRTTDFQAGDACIFGIDLLHVSASNTTPNWRLSCDTRWYRPQ